MRRLCYAAAVVTALGTFSNRAQAQDEADDSGWFEPSEDAASAEPEGSAAEQPAGDGDARAKPAAVEPAQTRATSSAHEQNGCSWHRGKHRHRTPRGSRSLSLLGGGMRLDAPELGDALERAGYDEPSKLRFVGLQGTRVLPGRVVLGLGASVGWSERLEREDGAGGRLLLLQLRGQLGYALVHSEKWLLYPALELGFNRLELDLGAAGGSSFDDALAEPRTGTELVRNSFAAGGVVAIERRFPLRWKRANHWARFFSIGLRAGWMRDLVAGAWRVDGDDDARGPEENHSIKYVGISFGFGQARF